MKIIGKLPKILHNQFIGKLPKILTCSFVSPGYTAMVDDLLNTLQDAPSIGLLICKEKNTVLARYALSRINTPIGISEYELSKRQLPKEVESALPTIEEIETKLND